MQNELLILIIDPDVHFREELFNFLLSAGYKYVDTADDFTQALAKIAQEEPDVILIDINQGICNETINTIVKINSSIRVITMICAEEQEQWSQQSDTLNDFELIIKNTYTHNLLYILHRIYS